jgi:hypothetical protein
MQFQIYLRHPVDSEVALRIKQTVIEFPHSSSKCNKSRSDLKRSGGFKFATTAVQDNIKH